MNLLHEKFIPVFTPPHSSPLNSIETYWSLARRNWHTLLLKREDEIRTQEEFEQLVLKACEQVNEETALRVAGANREVVLDYLEKT
jgi:hypothetical protein